MVDFFMPTFPALREMADVYGEEPERFITESLLADNTENYPRTNQTWALVRMLFGKAGGYAFISKHNKGKWEQKGYETQTLLNHEYLGNILNAKCFGQENMYLSLCTYKKRFSKQESDLATICGIMVDVDYLKGKYKDIECKTASQMLCQIMADNDLPLPTYIEYGRNFKLVYIFDEPFIIHRNKGKSKGWIRRIGEVLVENIKKIDNGWGIDDFKLHPFVRIPGSINKKWEENDGRWFVKEIYEVNIDTPLGHYFSKWDIQKLSDKVLPDLKEWYADWDANRNAYNKLSENEKVIKLKRIFSKENLLDRRDRHFHEMQLWLGTHDIGYREQMCWIFCVNCIHKGMSMKEALEETVAFNHGFAHPLKDSTVRSECKPTWTGHITDKCIREHLGLDGTEGFFDGVTVTKEDKAKYDSNRRKKKYAAKSGYATKADQIANRLNMLESLIEQGLTNQQMADALGVSVDTVRKDKAKIKAEQKKDAEKIISIPTTPATQTDDADDENMPEKEGKVIHIGGGKKSHTKCIAPLGGVPSASPNPLIGGYTTDSCVSGAALDSIRDVDGGVLTGGEPTGSDCAGRPAGLDCADTKPIKGSQPHLRWGKNGRALGSEERE